MSLGDVSLACASLLIQRLAGAGLAGVCISPGSRSTPLALAAARTEGVPLHVHLDERSAAFFALGIAKATGRPAAVICTSGTAAVNLMPAVVEASLTRLPLIVLTADRPAGLRGTGANQTIDQSRLFGAYPRLFVETPLPAEGDGKTWHVIATSVLNAALGSPPGPVHVNVAFDEPLVPSGEPVALGDAAYPDAPTKARDETPFHADVVFVRDLLEKNEKGVVVAGALDDPAPSVAALARGAAWPLLADPLSNLRSHGALTTGQLVLPAFEPDVVLQVGRAPTARATQSFVARARSLVVVETPGIPADPARAAARTIASTPEALARAGAANPRALGTWFWSWTNLDRRMRTAVDDLLDSIAEPFEPRIARDVAAALPDGTTLFVGNSMPVRDLDAFMAPRDGLTVRANRGASGIDGTVSTALGIASTTAPVVALVGDLALLHDASGLLWAGRHARRTVFVVPNNGGGAIFDLLPQADLPEREKLFVTPHATDLRALAAAAGIHHARAVKAAEVPHALDHALIHGGCWLVEVVVDRARSLEHRMALRDVVSRTLAGAPGDRAG